MRQEVCQAQGLSSWEKSQVFESSSSRVLKLGFLRHIPLHAYYVQSAMLSISHVLSHLTLKQLSVGELLLLCPFYRSGK